MTTKQWQYIETLLDDILAFPPAKRKLQLAKWFGDDEQTHALASRLVQLADLGATAVALPSDIGGWVPLRCLASTSSSTDYLVRNAEDSGHPLAILQLGTIAFDEGPAIQNFREELKKVDSLSAESLCRIYDAGLDDFNHPYIVNEFVVGTPILEATRDRNTRSIVEIFRSLLINVDSAHSRNVANGNFHPAHILIGMADSIRLPGFAVPRILALAANKPGFVLAPGIAAKEILYFSPEKLKGKADQIPGDIYSLGVIFYQMLSGSTPYGNRDESLVELASAISDKAPARIAGLEDVLNNIVQKMLAKSETERYPDLASIAVEIDDYLQGRHLKAEVKEQPRQRGFAQAILQQGRHRWVAATFGFAFIAATAFGVKKYTSGSAEAPLTQPPQASSVQVEKTPAPVAAAFLNATFDQTKNQPELQRAFSQAYIGLAEVELSGQPKQALQSSLRAYELSSKSLDRGPFSDSLALEYALAARTHIYLLALSGDYKKAIEVNQQWQKRFSKLASANIESIRASALANTTLANLQYESKLGTSPSDSVFQRDRDSLRKLTQGATSIRNSAHANFAQSLVSLGEAVELSKQSSKAIEVYAESRRVLEKAALLENNKQDLRACLADTLIHIAKVQVKSANVGTALEASNQAIELARQNLAKQEGNPSLRRLLARALAANASVLVAAKHAPEALKVQGEAIAQWQQLERSYGLDPGDKVELNKARLIVRG
ncbi:MAG: hypothetical protein NTW74_23910 [Acidobacteria bacterium]|nr:hypothetical protein [Acidobacteriota bacterium]